MPQVTVRLKNGECEERDLPKPNRKGVSISAAVGVGGRNVPSDVKTIQTALNNVPPSGGGPVPPLDVDGFVGPKTNGAIAAFQRHHFGWADSRVDPDNLTIATLRVFQPNNAGGVATPPTPRNAATLPLVYATIPIAQRLIAGARRSLASSRMFLLGNGGFGNEAGDRYATLNVFFSLDKLPKSSQLPAVDRIDGVFQNMQKALARSGFIGEGHGIFQPDPMEQNDTYAFTYAGGFTRRGADGGPMMSQDDNYEGPNLREDSIYICTGLDGNNGDFTAYNTVHELAHWVGPEKGNPNSIRDFSYRHKADFYSLQPDTALRTADSYAMFSVAASERGLAEDAMIFMPPMVIHAARPTKGAA
jgi:peptidoglycan hydrolase-like protein with peptidoglycan-binding domain